MTRFAKSQPPLGPLGLDLAFLGPPGVDLALLGHPGVGLALLGLSRVDLALLGPPGEQESLKLSRVNKQARSVPTALRAPGGPE